MMIFDAATQAKIEACQDAAHACGAILARAGHDAKLLADKKMITAVAEALRVTKLSADCLQRLPDLQEMVLRVCVEIAERAALACAEHHEDEVLACGESLAACAAICAAAPGLSDAEMIPAPDLPEPGIAAVH